MSEDYSRDLGGEQYKGKILHEWKQLHHSDGEGNADGDSPTTDTIERNNEGQILREQEALNLDVGQKTQFRDSNWDQLEHCVCSPLTISPVVSLNNYCSITGRIKIRQTGVVHA